MKAPFSNIGAAPCATRAAHGAAPTLLVISLLLPGVALAQDLEVKGVSTYGRPAVRKLYQQPKAPQGAVGKSGRGHPRGAGTRDFTDTMMSGGMPRRYLVHVPTTYNAARPTPMIMVFHGLKMNGRLMPVVTGMNAAADRHGFIVVYPDGAGNRWADGYQQSSVDDVGFVKEMIQRLSQTVNIDQRRIFACGLSNGGFFTQRLACEMPGRIAGIAVVAAGAFQQVCSTCRTGGTPAIFFFGTEDPLVPRDGESKSLGKLGELVGLGDLGIDSLGGNVGKFAGLLSQQETVEFWVKQNSAGSPTAQYMPDTNPRDGCRVLREVYGGGHREVDVYTVEGGGHAWPGGLSMGQVMGKNTTDINASELICQFFRSH